MSTLFEWDELNLIREETQRIMALPPDKRKQEKKRYCDYLEYVLCLVYAYGWHDAEEIVGIVPFEESYADDAVNLEIADKTWRERAEEWLDDGTAAELLRLIETETVRDYNAGVTGAGKHSGISGLRKRWNTMLDFRVRDAHRELEGQEVGIDDLFYTADDSAYAPGGFSDPSLNCNCRCYLTLTR